MGWYDVPLLSEASECVRRTSGMDAVEAIGEALHILFARLETLRNLDGTAMLFPENIQPSRSTPEEAYAA